MARTRKITRVLVANRGEIALRVIRTCREMGIETVAVYSSSDRNSLAIVHSDYAVHLPGKTPGETYLQIGKLIDIARKTKCNAVHPGYGFLAENAEFAAACAAAKIKFIGPTPQAITDLGNKLVAKEIMAKEGIPIIPGSQGSVGGVDEAGKIIEEIGLPVMLKAAAGGGGRGMRVVREGDDVERAFRACRSEAKGAFGSEEIFIERYVENPKHIEFQVLADEHGSVIHLGERDCSIQRRHQKLIEEAPSPALTPKLREEMGKAATRAARAAGYTNAGTVEFLLDKENRFYFIEMNTRLQVEHPVTEEITGVDIVRQQLLIAMGKKLEFKQKDIRISGHSFEARINAEDPFRQFLPVEGRINRYIPPLGRGVRLDAGAYEGYTIPMEFDSMIAKLIVTGSDRKDAIARMNRSLNEFIITGVKTTIPFHQFVFCHPEFISGKHDTGFVERNFTGDSLTYLEADVVKGEVGLDAAISAALGYYLAKSKTEVSDERGDRDYSAWELAHRREQTLFSGD